MITGEIRGTPAEITAWARGRAPQCVAAEHSAQKAVEGCSAKQRIYPYQAHMLFALAAQYNGGRILEIGTYYGYSAAVMAQAAPLAHVDTLNVLSWEVSAATKNLQGLPNVHLWCTPSWDYLESYAGPDYDLVFVDANHKEVDRDLPWWGRLAPGGLMLFHDYSPATSPRACPPVYRALNEWKRTVGPPNLLIIDDQDTGMAGWYKEADNG